ncbi:hypothetical protein K523DRAFT_415626 [Schizophyllum commune Tattone D]|nr:hypothetical protein K523DRAFT_415626 [Schizophyllum commune Tattone D]
MSSSEEATEKRDSNAPAPDYPMEGIATSGPSGEDVDVPMSDSRIEANTASMDLKETADATMEGSASDASSDDGDEPSVDNPSTDISGDLDRALHDLSRTFTGEIASHKTYLDAPIPGLNLLASDIGPVGLPLNEREAKVVKSGCKQAPFGKGERTVVDKSVRDTWEMDASLVHFNNAAWNDFMQRVLKDVCTTLGVNMAVSNPRCELYKLLLYETGSHFLPHVDTEKVGSMFATIIVVLPSPFTGGAAHLSHANKSEVFDCSENSAHQMTVLSWYTDVTHSIEPITSGYRLALSYNVYHTTNTLRPSLPTTHSAVNALRHVLLSWKQANGPDVPRKVIYLLDHQYTQANKTGSALKGADAHKLGILQGLAKELGFQLGLASLKAHVTGYADDDEYTPRAYGVANFMEVEERELKIRDLTDLDGNLLKEKIDFEDEGIECIPREFTNAVENGEFDDENYEGYQGNEAGTLERWYQRTVLVLWPLKFDINKSFKDDIDDAIRVLLHVTPKAHKRERRLADFLINVARSESEPSRRLEVTHAVCHAACCWTDRALFLRATEIFTETGVEGLGPMDIVAAAQAFGMDFVEPVVEKMLVAEKLNARRLQLLDELQASCSTLEDMVKVRVLAWVAEQRNWALEHLQSPQDDDAQVLLDAARKHGTLRVLPDVIVPQIKANASTSFLTKFATLLHTEKVKPDTLDADKIILEHTVKDLVATAISKVDFFVPVPVHYWSSYYSKPTPRPGPAVASTYIDLCLSTDNESLLDDVVARLTDVSDLPAAESYSRAENALLPLLPLVGEKVKARTNGTPHLPGSLQRLFDVTFQLYLSGMSQTSPSEKNAQALVRACTFHGGAKLLAESVWPAVKAATYREDPMYAFLREVQQQRDQLPVSEGAASVDWLISDILRFLIAKALFNGSQGDRSTAINLLKLCASCEHPELYCSVLVRLLDSTFVDGTYISNVLVPFIPQLRQFLNTQKIPTHAEPFGTFFTAVVGLWTKHVLGPKPASTPNDLLARLKGHSCRCSECARAFNWLTSGAGRTLELIRIGAPKRKHVESELASHATGAAQWELISSSPQGLKITKTEVIYEPVEWQAKHTQGQAMLDSISRDQGELRQVFGANYQVIMGALQGLPTLQEQAATLTLALAAPPAVTAGQTAPAEATSQQASSSAQPTTRKRKASNDPSTVIDLSNENP